jgi:hypothetical protein
MNIRLFIDEDAMSRSLVAGLRARGIEVTTVLEATRTGLSDEAQLAWAAAAGWVLCTGNVADFFRLHTAFMMQGKSHAGIIFIPQQRYSVGVQIRKLLHLVATRSAESMQNEVVFLSAL